MVKLFFFFLCFLCFNGVSLGGEFNVMDYGAKADGITDDAQAFEDAWKAACGSNGPATIWIPKGTYLVGPVKFTGPCKSVPRITMKMEGYLKAETDLDKYPTGDWIFFGWINKLSIVGTGTFDGQGGSIWHLNDCQQNQKCKLLPTNLKFVSMTDTYIEGITSLNSKNFHFGVIESNHFRVRRIKIIAPDESPNTDGMHVERCSDVFIENSRIGTGDDCISLGQGLSNVFISGINCGPGHGISVGSLGKYPQEKDVSGIIVKNSNFTGTLNGVRIKTWPNSPSPSAAHNITFENIIMKNVNNPIIIDQLYCPSGNCPNQTPSRVKISDVFFKNIRGSSSSETAVTLHCSPGFPCRNVQLQDIKIRKAHSKKNIQKFRSSVGAQTTSSCMNIKALYSGTQVPAPCS